MAVPDVLVWWRPRWLTLLMIRLIDGEDAPLLAVMATWDAMPASRELGWARLAV